MTVKGTLSGLTPTAHRPPTCREELVIEELVEAGPRAGIRVEEAADEVTGGVAHEGRDDIFVGGYARVRLLQRVRLEGRLTHQERVPAGQTRPHRR